MVVVEEKRGGQSEGVMGERRDNYSRERARDKNARTQCQTRE